MDVGILWKHVGHIISLHRKLVTFHYKLFYLCSEFILYDKLMGGAY